MSDPPPPGSVDPCDGTARRWRILSAEEVTERLPADELRAIAARCREVAARVVSGDVADQMLAAAAEFAERAVTNSSD